MKNHYELIKQYFFRTFDASLRREDVVNDPERLPLYLSAAGVDQGVTDGAEFAAPLVSLTLAYYLEGSPRYRDPELLERVYQGLCHYEQYIHEDGSDDLLTTNFHDPAQTGFHVHSIYLVTELIAKLSAHTPEEDRLFEKIREILLQNGRAMARLGFHTPNHRWVISSGLAIAYRYTGEQEFLDAIEEFLREGVDCDEFGEYTERSAGSYNNICNYSFMVMGYMLDREEFFDYPRRNIRLMYHLIEPDGTVNTLNSTRWDNRGEYTIEPYYPHYVLLGLIDRDPEFAYMADTIYGTYGDAVLGTRSNLILTYLTLHPEIANRYGEITPRAPAKDQSCFLPNSRYARVYKPDHALTMTALCARGPVFFQMNYGSSVLQARFAGSFFGDPHSQFRATQIVPTADGYKLICDERAGYKSRLPEKPETSDWRKMDHSKRKVINMQNFRTEITAHILEDGVTLEIETFGCERIPTKLELTMPPNGKLYTRSIMTKPKAGDYFFFADDKAKYFVNGLRYFEIEGGFFEHWNAEHMRGAFPADQRRFTIAMTASTPQKSSVTIRVKTLLDTEE
ncbi:MAG: hypothetical protein IKM00_03405 [Clostridia bacterium]|nr:hypothetical protein [Clostridia bacterium]